MSSINKVMIIGNLGRDPEIRSFPDGGAVCNIAVATTETWKDKQTGEKKEATEWHRVSFNGRLAEIAAEYLRKGSSVYVEGSLRTRKYTDKDGVEKYSTEIRADQMRMLGGKPEGDTSNQPQQRQQAPQQRQQAPQQRQPQQRQQEPRSRAASGFDDMDDDIPF